MSKHCPLINERVTYLYCQECDDKICQSVPKRCKITGRLYKDTPVYSSWDVKKEFPRYESIEGTERLWVLDHLYSIDEAKGWLLENHPDYYMGSCIAFEGTGDFAAAAVPCAEYEKGYFETHQGRHKYAELLAERFGVPCGESEYAAL